MVIPGDKISCVIVTDKDNDIKKTEEIVNDGTERELYIEAKCNTLQDPKRFQDFLYQKLKNNKH